MKTFTFLILLIPFIFSSCTAGLDYVINDTPMKGYYDDFPSTINWLYGLFVWAIFVVEIIYRLGGGFKIFYINGKKFTVSDPNYTPPDSEEVNFVANLVMLLGIILIIIFIKFDIDYFITSYLPHYISNLFLQIILILIIVSVLVAIVYFINRYITKVLTIIRYTLYGWQIIEIILTLFFKGERG